MAWQTLCPALPYCPMLSHSLWHFLLSYSRGAEGHGVSSTMYYIREGMCAKGVKAEQASPAEGYIITRQLKWSLITHKSKCYGAILLPLSYCHTLSSWGRWAGLWQMFNIFTPLQIGSTGIASRHICMSLPASYLQHIVHMCFRGEQFTHVCGC